MSYAIAEIIYGAPVTVATLTKIAEEVKIEELPEEFLKELTGDDDLSDVTMDLVYECLKENETFFETRYTGSGDETPRFLGVVLCEFNEGRDVLLSSLATAPTPEQYIEAQGKLSDLPKAIRDRIPALDVYIIWHTS
jgi:hypothetical protein